MVITGISYPQERRWQPDLRHCNRLTKKVLREMLFSIATLGVQYSELLGDYCEGCSRKGRRLAQERVREEKARAESQVEQSAAPSRVSPLERYRRTTVVYF